MKTVNSQIQEPRKSQVPEIWGEMTYTKAQSNCSKSVIKETQIQP